LVIPFLGSGASLNRTSPEIPSDSGEVASLPTASELARILADQTNFPENEQLDLTKVAQLCHVVGGRAPLHRVLRGIFNRDYPCLSVHHYLASLDVPLLIVTTNYDDLIERAFDAKGRKYDVVIHTTDPLLGARLLWWRHGSHEPEKVLPNRLEPSLEATTVIYKMHGAIDRRVPSRDQYVITEDDYVEFLSRMVNKTAIPASFAEPFVTRHFLFLGYSLRDWNFRVVLNRIEKQLRRSHELASWAVQYDPSPLERRFWQGRGVEVYDLTIDEFVNELGSA
jgi:hypothetical protein